MGSGLAKKAIRRVSPDEHLDDDDEHIPPLSRKTKLFSLFNENTLVDKNVNTSPISKKRELSESPQKQNNESPSSDSSISSPEDRSAENSKEKEGSVSNEGSFKSNEKQSGSSESNKSMEKDEDSEESIDQVRDFLDYLNFDLQSYQTYLSPRTDNVESLDGGFGAFSRSNGEKFRKKIVISSLLPDLNKEETNDEKKFVMQIVDFTKTVFKSSENEENQHRIPAKYKCLEKDVLHELGINVISRKGSLSENPNQDDYFIFIDQNFRIFSVFDGHGPFGHNISNICYRLLMKRILEDASLMEDPALVLRNAFSKIVPDLKEYLSRNKALKKQKINMKFSGTTTTVILQREKTLYIAHLGDSRAVIGKKQKNKKSPYQLTTDHVPILPMEKKRIYQNGGEVRKLNNDYVEKVFVRGRIYPGLTISRSIGDEVGALIGVIDEPEINVYEINDQTDQFLLLGSKPVFNYLEDYEIINILSSFTGKAVKMASDFLYKRVKSAWIQNENGFDDITLVLVYL